MRFSDLGQCIVTNFSNPLFVVGFVVSIVIVFFFTGFLAYKINRALVWSFYILFDALFALSLIGYGALDMIFYISLACILLMTTACLFVNAGVIRTYFAMTLRTSGTKKKVEADIADKEAFLNQINETVIYLSKNKIGALMTFEKETPLADFMKNGTIINCPYTPEIVETIFYEGSRLHDGAIVIKGKTIVAAAVYYEPSTKAVTGKFGARHRAALGISEVTDSITVVVSEETGRVSIAHSGMFDHIPLDQFRSKLERYL